jgi:inosine-uridine nucleoside N-ribohydrolase
MRAFIQNKSLLHLAFCLLVTTTLTTSAYAAQNNRSTGRVTPVILDTDIGDDIDDTWALGFLLRCPELKLVLAVGDNGKPEYRARLLAKFLNEAGSGDVPVGLGMEVKTDGTTPQASWISDYQLSHYSGKIHRDGVQAIIDTIMKSPEPVTLIAIGPVQNIAEALKRQPGIAKRCRFVGMHGSVRRGYGSDRKAEPEYNVKIDTQACQRVFTADWEMTITPLDTCAQVKLSSETYQSLRKAHNRIAPLVIANYEAWTRDKSQKDQEAAKVTSTTLFDTVAVYLAFQSDFCAMENIGIRVTDAGMTVEDPAARKMNVALDWKDLVGFEHLLAERLKSAP